MSIARLHDLQFVIYTTLFDRQPLKRRQRIAPLRVEFRDHRHHTPAFGLGVDRIRQAHQRRHRFGIVGIATDCCEQSAQRVSDLLPCCVIF